MIRNLVVGSEGFVGKPFCKYLENEGEEVVRFDIKRSEKEDARFSEINLDEIDRVYFLAWDVGGAKYLYRKDAQFVQLDWNLKLLSNVMQQLNEKQTNFLFVSSQLAEECDTVYGVTKRLGEVWTKLLKGVRVRLWNVYGPIEEFNQRSHVISDFIYQAKNNKEIRMLTNGQEERQFVHINDVCRAFHMALENSLEGVYDVTSFEWCKVIDVANIISEYTGAKVIPGERSGSTPLTPIKGKIKDWQPSISLREGLKKMIDMNLS